MTELTVACEMTETEAYLKKSDTSDTSVYFPNPWAVAV